MLKFSCIFVIFTIWSSISADYVQAQNESTSKQPDVTPVKAENGICFNWQGTHYKTFDGRIYSFSSKCGYILVRDSVDYSFNIVVQDNPQCDTTPSKCSKIIKVYYGGEIYILKQSEEDGMPVFMSTKGRLPIPGEVDEGIRIKMSAHFLILSLDAVGLILKWNGKQMIQVEAEKSLWARTEGLCGKLDGDDSNDMLDEDGNSYNEGSELAPHWKFEDVECDDPPVDAHPCKQNINDAKSRDASNVCNSLLTREALKPCKNIIDYFEILDVCRREYCACENKEPKECACETVSVYVRACTFKEQKQIVDWRNKDTCPMLCPEGRVYRPCGPPSGQPVCGSSVEESSKDGCVEGCYCRDGTVLHENKCITRDKCPCMSHGKTYPPESQIPKDCNTCTCRNGMWDCTKHNCDRDCHAVGDPHYKTFDGKYYDFMGKCSYSLVKTDTFSIESENAPCIGYTFVTNLAPEATKHLPSCTRSVTVRHSGHIIHLKQKNEIVLDGEEVTESPYQISNITIRRLSSIFSQVDLPNGMLIKWDGVTSVFIHIPGGFKEKTKGLCGTFNYSPKDDFLTPEGDIEENVNSFGNKWKTSESCGNSPINTDNVNKKPCDVHIQNKPVAEKHCQVIKSSLFSPCLTIVDPEPHYQNCLYDMCSCGNNPPSKCLCATIAAYADECVKKGVKIDWRGKVKECSVDCPSGQKYQLCGNSCTRTCKDISISPNCKSKCVEGCNCPPGETLNEEGKCIPIPKCKCEYEGISFDPGYKAKKEGHLCTCTNATWICRPATPKENDKYPNFNPQARCNATEHMVYSKCAPVKPATCENMHVPRNSPCKPGCKCKNGYVLDTDTMKCVKPAECSCHHGGKSYKENATIKTDCSTCKCHYGKWICTNLPCTSKCIAWGDSHFKTFDGKHFDFQGQCDYMLAKGSLENRSFEISIQNVQCSTLKTSCSKSVTLRVKIGKDQESITLTRDMPLPSLENLKHFTLREVGLLVVIEAPNLGLVIQWDKGTRVYVKIDVRWKGKTMGLCGNNNENESDDFQTPSGGIPEVSANIFGNSWKLQSSCPEPIEITNTCEKRPLRKIWATKKCEILLSKVFAPCHSEVSVDLYFEKCIFDTCACDQGGDCECLCTALAAYAQECNNKGVPIKWRSQKLCPIQCDKRCTTYNPCISTCPVQTCDALAKDPVSTTCRHESCIEGCSPKPCPPDHIYQNSSLLECIPSKTCKHFCLEVDNVIYREGELMEEDACHKCYCSQQKKKCNGSPCPPTTEPVITPSTDPTPSPEPDICPIFDCGSGYEKILASSEKENTALEIVLLRPPVTKPTIEDCPKYICKNKISEECEKVTCPPDYILIIPKPGCSRCPDSYYCTPVNATCRISSKMINTFDGRSFNIRICNHILAEDFEHKRWKIIWTQKCGSCTKQLVIHHQDDTLEFNSTSTLIYNNFTYTIEQAKKIRSQSFSIEKTGSLLVFISHIYGFQLHLNDQDDVKIDTTLDLKEKIDGLCGYFNGNPSDDKRKPNGILATNNIEFVDSWQNGSYIPCENKTCPEELRKKAIELCQINNEVLKPCAKVINREANLYVARCVEKTCDCLQKAGTDQTAKEECRCNALTNYVVECLTVEPSTDLLDWRVLLNCPATCKAPLLFHDCYQRRCEYTCDTIRDPKACPKIPNVCFPGCYCPKGFVRQDETCIKPSECRNCQCHVYPSLKYVTYDENRLVVNSNCVFVMSRDVLGNAERKFQVLVTHAPCKNKKSKTCITKVTILYKGQEIHIFHDAVQDKLTLELNGDLTNISKWFLVEETVDKNYQIFLKDIHVDISVFYPGLGTTVKAPSAIYGGKLEGLCGNCDNDPKNDFTTPSGKLVKDRNEFALSWLYENQNKDKCKEEETTCTPLPNKKDPCKLIQNPSIFGQCHQVLDPDLFLEWCRKDTCDNHPELACASIEAYAKGCANQGLCIDWRMDICPKICPPGTVYNPCGPICPKTCENVKGGGKSCPNKLSDGCFCPEGKVLLNNTCVEERKCIVCDDEGHHPGDKWRKDKCTTCSCEGTILKCVRDKCPAAQTCKEGFRLVKKPPVKDECCDTYECIQEACIVNGKPKYPNETWTSTDKCTTFTCTKRDNYFAVVETKEACPSVKDCPIKNIYNDGCCKRCNMTIPSKRLCAVEEIPSEETRYLITVEHPNNGQCENDEPIPNFTRCKGTCFSSSIFKSGTKMFENKCSCCKPTKIRELVVELACTNGETIEEKVLVPTECGCREDCN